MPTSEASELFVKNLNLIMERRGVSQADVARALNVSTAIVSGWCLGRKMPRMDNVTKLAEFLKVKVSTFMSENGIDEQLDDLDRLDALHNNPRLGMLFDRSARMSDEDINFMIQMADRILKERDT